MLCSVKRLGQYTTRASKSDLGYVADFYIDYQNWAMHCLGVTDGDWQSAQRLLLTPEVLRASDEQRQAIPTTLTPEQIAVGPEVQTDAFISSQYKAELAQYEDWPIYRMQDGAVMPGIINEFPFKELIKKAKVIQVDRLAVQLPSLKPLIGHRISATDGDAGRLVDFMVDDQAWRLRYMVIETRDWLPGNPVLVSPFKIKIINLAESCTHIGLRQAEFKACLRLNPTTLTIEDIN